MINRVLRKLKTVAIVLLAALSFQAIPVAAGPLNLEEGIQYLYDEAKKNRVIATVWDWKGNKSAALGLKYAVFHNKAKTLHFASIMIGMDLTLQKKPRGRFLLTPSLNLIDISRWIWERDAIKKHLTVTSGPKGWELYIGPMVRPPDNKWSDWTWHTHTGFLASLGVRIGGKALPDNDQ